MGGEQALHQFREIVGLRADIMNELFLVGNGLPDVVLVGSVVRVPEPGIDDAVLYVDQKRLLAKSLCSAISSKPMNFSVREALGLMCSISNEDLVSLL